MSTKAKTRYIAEQSLYAFARRNPLFYFWTLTFLEDVTKEEAERRWKPVRDMMNRDKCEHLAFWERTQRGRWHIHFVINRYLDVNWMRPWLLERGWGQQIKARRIEASPARFDGRTWRSDESCVVRVVRYLVKYCTKSLGDSAGTRKKIFTADRVSKLGTVAFAWVPWVNPTSYLYANGREMWYVLNGCMPKFHAFADVVRLGVEVTGWLSIDPWWMPLGP